MTLHGIVDPRGQTISRHVSYGLSTAYSASTPTAVLGATGGAQAVAGAAGAGGGLPTLRTSSRSGRRRALSRGRTLAQAKARLRKAHRAVGNVRRRGTGKLVVRAQNVRAGKRSSGGTRVSLVLPPAGGNGLRPPCVCV